MEYGATVECIANDSSNESFIFHLEIANEFVRHENFIRIYCDVRVCIVYYITRYPKVYLIRICIFERSTVDYLCIYWFRSRHVIAF